MQKITTVEGLKNAIQQLEYKQANDWPLLKEQFLAVADTLKPGNIMKGTFKELLSGPDLKTNLVNAVIGLTSGIVATKVFVGKTPNPLLKLIVGAIVGMATATNGSKTLTGIKLIGSNILKKILHQPTAS